MVAEYVSLDSQLKELDEKYKYKTLLSVRDLRDIFGWSKTEVYRKIDSGVFDLYGDVPKDAKKIPKNIVFSYFRSLF